MNEHDAIDVATEKRLIEVLGRGSASGNDSEDYVTLTTRKASRINFSKVSSSGNKFSLLSSLWLESQLSSLSNLISFINTVLDNNYPTVASKKLDFMKSFDRGGIVLDSFFKSTDFDVKSHRKPFGAVRRISDPRKSK